MRKSRKLQVAVPIYCCLNICKHKIPVKRQGHFSPGFGLQLSLQKECAFFFLLLLCHKLYLSYRSLQPGWYPLKCHAIYGRDTVFTFWTANFTKSALYIVEVNTARFSSVTEQKKTAERTVLDRITWTVIFMEGQVLNETVEVRVAYLTQGYWVPVIWMKLPFLASSVREHRLLYTFAFIVALVRQRSVQVVAWFIFDLGHQELCQTCPGWEQFPECHVLVLSDLDWSPLWPAVIKDIEL